MTPFPFNFELLRTILEIPSQSYDCTAMQCFIWDYAEARGWTIVDDSIGNLYITKGQAVNFPCIVAHMDTVHKILPGGIKAVMVGDDVVTGINTRTMRQTGIGGDDKCGIFAALELLENLPFAKAVMFVDEEVGCDGSQNCDLEFFYDCRFVLQTDRRGNSDFVNDIWGGISSDRFQDDVLPFLEKYNFRFADGMMTDVQALRDREVGISCANISSGYYNPHQDNEYIVLSDLSNTLDLMYDICVNLTDVYPFICQEKWHKWKQQVSSSPSSYIDEKGKKTFIIPNDGPPFEFDEEDEESYLAAYAKKYGDFPDEEGQVGRTTFQHKSISEMTDAEWLEYQNDSEDSLEDETAQLEAWFETMERNAAAGWR